MEEHDHVQQSETDETREERRATGIVTMSRRTMLHRFAFGLGGIGMVTLLSACADEDEDPLSSDPLLEPETQIEDHTDIVETEVVGEEAEDEED